MQLFNLFLLAGAIAVVAGWTGLTLYVFVVEGRRARARAVLTDAIAALDAPELRGLPLADQVARVRPLLDRLSRELVMHAVARGDAPPDVTAALTTYLLDTWREDRLLDDAASHRSRRDKWRRMAALRIVAQLDADRALDLLARAVAEPDPDVASTALSLLGRSTDPRAVDILIGALRAQRHPASKVAAHLERSPQPIAAAMTPLLRDSDAVVRAWAATLLGQSTDAVEPGTTNIERELAAVASDADPRVRKAAVQALGRVGGDLAARTARHLMTDPVPYVRAHAARALADLDRVELAPEIAVLLGDTDWWVRHAAKQALETLGSEVWPVLVRALDDEDKFVRNGAAEVIQNLGILDTLIVMEAATDLPSPKKIDLLRRIASAGGARLTDSLLERTGPALGPRMRHLLTTLGLEHVEAA
jgi:HEAT repeat protein